MPRQPEVPTPTGIGRVREGPRMRSFIEHRSSLPSVGCSRKRQTGTPVASKRAVLDYSVSLDWLSWWSAEHGVSLGGLAGVGRLYVSASWHCYPSMLSLSSMVGSGTPPGKRHRNPAHPTDAPSVLAMPGRRGGRR